jgi:hypothetical protein
MLVATASSFTGDTLKALSWFGYTGFEIVSRLGIPVWPSPRRGWQGGKAVNRKLEKAVRRFEKALSRRPSSLSLKQVLQLSVMKATPASDPKFFQADHEYYQKLYQNNFKVSGWKKLLGKLVYRIVYILENRRLKRIKEGADS